jgi:hypothetical protein
MASHELKRHRKTRKASGRIRLSLLGIPLHLRLNTLRAVISCSSTAVTVQPTGSSDHEYSEYCEWSTVAGVIVMVGFVFEW